VKATALLFEDVRGLVGVRLSTHAKGIAITVAGVLVLTPESLLIRLVGASQWTVLLWRGVFMAVGITFIFWMGWARGHLLERLSSIGSVGIVAAGLFACDNTLFVTALRNTSVANTLLMISTAPMWGALLSWVILRERVPIRTWLAIAAVMAGVVVIFSGSIGHTRLRGDLAALGAAIAIATTLVLIRKARTVNMMPAMALGGLVTAVVVAPMASPSSPRGADIGLLVLLGLVVAPVAFGLIALGPRYLPVPEVNLIMMLETVVGPLWVWLALGDRPGSRTFVGGALVVATLATHFALALTQSHPEDEPVPELLRGKESEVRS